jgi:hypothetical protein
MAGLRLFNFGRQLLELSMRVRGARHWFGPTERAATRKFVVLSDQIDIIVAEVGEASLCHQRRQGMGDYESVQNVCH